MPVADLLDLLFRFRINAKACMDESMLPVGNFGELQTVLKRCVFGYLWNRLRCHTDQRST
jgi:hypothetical protein